MKIIAAITLQEVIENNSKDDLSKSSNLNMDCKESKPCLQKPHQHKRIVVIDDESKIRVLFKNILSKAGYATIAFGDNAHAIQYLKENDRRIDLLLLDLDMPHINGRYFCEMMRIKHPRAKIIIASNYAIDIQKHMITNADDYFDKSEGTQILKEKIKSALSN